MVKQTFSPGALVFGKVKGYPPWPARVTAVAGKDRWVTVGGQLVDVVYLPYSA
jgi:hypothetical protein